VTPTLENPVDVLLAAATVAEEFADAATEGPWANLDRGDRIIRDTGDDVPLEYVVGEPMEHEGNAAHITLWQPPVARTVAAWLRACAATWPTQPVITTTEARSAERRAALATARALLTAKDRT
jgi:chitodextrinase